MFVCMYMHRVIDRFFFVTLSVIFRLSRDFPVVSGGNCSIHSSSSSSSSSRVARSMISHHFVCYIATKS